MNAVLNVDLDRPDADQMPYHEQHEARPLSCGRHWDGLSQGVGVFAAQPSGEVEDTPSESSKQPVVDELRARVREPRANVVPPEKNQIETRVDSVVGFN
jgi:hypothetical protein